MTKAEAYKRIYTILSTTANSLFYEFAEVSDELASAAISVRDDLLAEIKTIDHEHRTFDCEGFSDDCHDSCATCPRR